MADSEHKRRYMTPKEYMEAQKARGGCAEDFKETMIKSGKLGVGFGIPFGAYIAYGSNQRSIKSFLSKSVYATLTTTTFFGAIGLIAATYNCLRVDNSEK